MSLLSACATHTVKDDGIRQKNTLVQSRRAVLVFKPQGDMCRRGSPQGGKVQLAQNNKKSKSLEGLKITIDSSDIMVKKP